MKDIVSGFKAFILRGNLVEVAVALIIALAFVAVIDSLVTNLFTPLIALVVGEPFLGGLTFEINSAVFFYGQFIDDVITFLGVAIAVYFFIVLPYNRASERMKRGQPEPDATTRACPECASLIPVEARRCAFCTSVVAA
jgi:large conductance mechanosensitive channel